MKETRRTGGKNVFFFFKSPQTHNLTKLHPICINTVKRILKMSQAP